jgi:hypothetical protein
MWKIGPECAAQQKKKVRPNTANWGERRACAADIWVSPALARPATPPPVLARGGRRTNSAVGRMMTQTRMPIISIAGRQS